MAHRLIIRYGADHDEVVIDGHTFDRSKLTRHQRNAMTTLIVETLFPHKGRRRFGARKAQS